MPIVCTLTDSAQTTTSATNTNTFAAMNIGAASADRFVAALIGIYGSGGGSVGAINSVTIGGVDASLIAAARDANIRTVVAFANVPTGTTADVVINCAASNVTRWGAGVLAITGLYDSTIIDSNSDTIDPCVASISCTNGGLIAGVSCGATVASFPTSTWTNLTEAFDLQIGSTTAAFSGAFQIYTSAQTGLSVTCDNTGTGTDMAMSLASFQAADNVAKAMWLTA